MKVLRAVCVALALVACCAPGARGEGFALNEWSARGLALAGGMRILPVRNKTPVALAGVFALWSTFA